MAESLVQRFFLKILPAAWAADMRADSEAWKLRCRCGHERSIWSIGGIRWRAVGNSRNLTRCPRCGAVSWHTLSRDERPPT